MDCYKAIVIGGSAGSFEVLTAILSKLPHDFHIPICIAQHVHPTSDGYLAKHLDSLTPISVIEARDKEPVQQGYAYIAPANYHLLIEKDETLSLSVDEKVNWSRPSIDVLFESAAYVWSRALIGVILSGANGDGAQGMCTIKKYGGFTIAQDPKTAAHPPMPNAAIEADGIHAILDPKAIAAHLIKLNAATRQSYENYKSAWEEEVYD